MRNPNLFVAHLLSIHKGKINWNNIGNGQEYVRICQKSRLYDYKMKMLFPSYSAWIQKVSILII